MANAIVFIIGVVLIVLGAYLYGKNRDICVYLLVLGSGVVCLSIFKPISNDGGHIEKEIKAKTIKIDTVCTKINNAEVDTTYVVTYLEEK